MYKREKSKKENRNKENQHVKNPSFSSTLLDGIYVSIDRNSEIDLGNPKDPRFLADAAQRKQIEALLKRRSHYLLDKNPEDRFLKSRSSSSDSSDTEFMYGKKNSRLTLGFGASHPQVTEPDHSQYALFYKNRACHSNGDFRDRSPTDRIPRPEEDLEKTKANKKLKIPVSPGGRFVSFINSLFNNSKKSTLKNSGSSRRSCDEGQTALHINKTGFNRKSQDNSSICSSAPAVSGFCLNKNSEISRNGVKKTVTFSPVTVDENREEKGKKLMCLHRKKDEEIDKFKIRRSVEEKAREILRGYELTDRRKEVLTDVSDDDDEDDEDGCSDSSSDLFELDLGGNNNRYREELPVYETTCAAALIM